VCGAGHGRFLLDLAPRLRNPAAAVAIHCMYMNYGRPHKSLAKPYPRTPAMAAGLSEHIWTCEEVAALLD